MKPPDEIAALYSGETASKYADLVNESSYIGPQWLKGNLKKEPPDQVGFC